MSESRVDSLPAHVPQNNGPPPECPTVCIQGLGFVGLAMATAVADATGPTGERAYAVIGVEQPNERGERIAAEINRGNFPIRTSDPHLAQAFSNATERGTLRATTDVETYCRADIVVVDVHLDVDFETTPTTVCFDKFRSAIRTIASRAQPGTLILIETTVPPGTCEKVVIPVMGACLQERGLDPNALFLAHSYERVMPGPEYFDSIKNFWRVYAGRDQASAEKCRSFLETVINTEDYPLTRLGSLTASETAKILENSYRATNIAFIEEWGRFAEQAGIDLFEVINAIRLRPTHSNMRQPGFGVGGYCLTKDPLFAGIASRQLLDLPKLKFPFSEQAVAVNQQMPLVSLARLCDCWSGTCQGKRVLLCGVSYRSDVADTRYSPSETFVRELERRGATVIAQDPFVEYWEELKRPVVQDIPAWDEFDAVVFAVAHPQYRELDFAAIADGATSIVLDSSSVLTPEQIKQVQTSNCILRFIGRGDLS